MKKKLKSQGASDKQESLFGPEWQSASTDVELLQLMKYDFDQVFLLEFCFSNSSSDVELF
jgi:hypothetical protein